MLTIDQINAMSPEERSATNRKLAKKAASQFFVMHALKWVAIISVTRTLRKALETSNH